MSPRAARNSASVWLNSQLINRSKSFFEVFCNRLNVSGDISAERRDLPSVSCDVGSIPRPYFVKIRAFEFSVITEARPIAPFNDKRRRDPVIFIAIQPYLRIFDEFAEIRM